MHFTSFALPPIFLVSRVLWNKMKLIVVKCQIMIVWKRDWEKQQKRTNETSVTKNPNWNQNCEHHCATFLYPQPKNRPNTSSAERKKQYCVSLRFHSFFSFLVDVYRTPSTSKSPTKESFTNNSKKKANECTQMFQGISSSWFHFRCGWKMIWRQEQQKKESPDWLLLSNAVSCERIVKSWYKNMKSN